MTRYSPDLVLQEARRLGLTGVDLEGIVTSLRGLWKGNGMKPRRVIVTLEIETDAPLRKLAAARDWNDWYIDPHFTADDGSPERLVVKQASANVIRPSRKPRPLAGSDRIVREKPRGKAR